MDNSYKKVLDDAQAEVSQLTQKVIELDNAILKMASNLKTIDSKKLANSQATETIKAQNEALKRLNATIEKQNNQITKLTQKKKEINTLTGQEVANQRILKRNVDLQTQAVSKLAGAYGRLVAKQKQQKKILQDLIISQGKNSAQTKKAQREYNKLTKKINQANRATSNFSKTGLGSMVRGFKNLLGAFGVAAGIAMFAQFAKAGFNLARKLDGLNFTMKAVIEDSITLKRTQDFLIETAEKYGASILTLTERYNKFFTAAKQAGLGVQETENIFKSFTKSAGFLGLKAHELNGVFLALEQMLSKGKVTTEELRRQLGERLPGAFGVMADTVNKLNPNIEVTVEVLDSMLKKGEILSHEVLPEFAKQYEKAIGVEQKDRVETLNASLERMTNSWVTFVGGITESDGAISNVLRGILDLVTDIIDSFNELSRGEEGLTESIFKGAKKETLEYLKTIEESNKKTIEWLKNSLSADKLTSEQRKKSTKELAQLEKDQVEAAKAQAKIKKENAEDEINLLGIKIFQLKEEDKLASKTFTRDTPQKDNTESIEKANRELSRQKGILKGVNEFLKGNTEETKNNNDSIDDGNIKREKQISIGEDFLKYLAETEKRIKAVDKEIKKHIDTNIDVSEAIEKAKEATKDIAKAEKERLYQVEKLNIALKEMEGFFNEFSSEMLGNAGFDFVNDMFFQLEDGVSKFEKLSEAAKTSGDEFAFMFNTITEIGQEAFNFLQTSQNQYFDNQYSRLEQQRDIAIQFAGESTSAQEEIERQYEARRKQIATEQAKAQKKQAMFNIGIDTAQAIMATLGKTGFAGIPLSVIVGAIGAAQLAMVAATKVPEFFRGTENAPEGWALVDEKVPEVHTDKQGNVKSFGGDKANHRYLNAGDKIYKSREDYLQNILNFTPNDNMFSVSPVINVDKGISKDDFKNGIDSLGSIIKSKEGTQVSIDKNGFKVWRTNGSQRTENMNNVIRLKGREV